MHQALDTSIVQALCLHIYTTVKHEYKTEWYNHSGDPREEKSLRRKGVQWMKTDLDLFLKEREDSEEQGKKRKKIN